MINVEFDIKKNVITFICEGSAKDTQKNIAAAALSGAMIRRMQALADEGLVTIRELVRDGHIVRVSVETATAEGRLKAGETLMTVEAGFSYAFQELFLEGEACEALR